MSQRALPSRWQAVSLADVCEFRYGKSLPEAKRKSGDISVYGSNGVVGNHDDALTNGETIIVGRKGSVGEVCYSGQRCWAIDTTYYIDSTCTTANLKWLFYQLQGLGLTELNRAAAVPGLNRDDAYRKHVLLPPISEQRRIAAILDKADELRAKRKRVLEMSDSLTKAIFLEMFGDPVTNPKEWRSRKCGEICDRITVGIVVKPASYYVDDGVPALRSLNIIAGQINLQEMVYVSKIDNETRLAKTRLKSGDVVIVRSGRPGTAAVVPRQLGDANAIDILIATPQNHAVDSNYLCAFLNSSGGKQLVSSEERGQVQKHLNVGSLSDANIPCPPLSLQKEFSSRLDTLKSLRRKQRSALMRTEELLEALRQRAFRGEL